MPDENDIEYTTYGIDVAGLFERLYNAVTGATGGVEGAGSLLLTIWQVYSIFAFFISGLFLIGIIYAKIRYHHYHELEQQELRQSEEAYARQMSEKSQNTRWQDALGHIDSENPNDWRLAIIEADIMLDELLNTLGYTGTTIGDKLKQATPQNFRTIDDAWKAHKVRNDIAHRGTDFVLTKRIARETLDRYQRVFEEFAVI